MDLINLIMLVVTGTGIIIIFCILAERKYNFIERIVRKKLRVEYFFKHGCLYKIFPVDGVFLAISNGNYSCFFARRAYTMTEDEYEFEVVYDKKDPVMSIFDRRYEFFVLNVIFAGKFLPKYKCVFHLPVGSVVHQGKITMSEPPIVIQPDPVPIFTPTS